MSPDLRYLSKSHSRIFRPSERREKYEPHAQYSYDADAKSGGRFNQAVTAPTLAPLAHPLHFSIVSVSI